MPSLKSKFAISFAPFKTQGKLPPIFPALYASSKAWNLLKSGLIKVSEPIFVKSKDSPLTRTSLFGYVKAYWIARRISGVPICPITEVSSYSTAECKILSGWIKTSIWS